jgi:hypothetical protein
MNDSFIERRIVMSAEKAGYVSIIGVCTGVLFFIFGMVISGLGVDSLSTGQWPFGELGTLLYGYGVSLFGIVVSGVSLIFSSGSV